MGNTIEDWLEYANNEELKDKVKKLRCLTEEERKKLGIERLLKIADWIEFHRQQCVGGKHTDEINRWANYNKEQIARHIRNIIQRYQFPKPEEK